MGDQLHDAVEGTLFHVPPAEFDRVRRLNAPTSDRTGLFATLARINALYMIAKAGSGHIGSSFSSLDIVSLLHLQVLEPDDVYFSSKGHDAPGLYAVLAGLSRLPPDSIHALRRLGGLPGHPDVGTPGIAANTGSLGMGVSKAKGMVQADRLTGRKRRVFVLTGDGELQEGQFWESLPGAANHGMHEITAIVDHNKLQSDTFVSRVSDLGDLEAKFHAFGWHVGRCDGHDLTAIKALLTDFAAVTDRPKVLIADTVKGRGVSFMEHTSMVDDQEFYHFHSGAPQPTDYRRAVEELVGAANGLLVALGSTELALETTRVPPAVAQPPKQRLVPAYSQALIAAARRRPEIVALDADLILDTGLIPFRNEFPRRFFECGIAEQDMVSQASGMALSGLLPVIHSFACFLTPRANEQMYNACSERRRIVYVGSLAGLIPAGPGHSHQAIRDISVMASLPGLVALEPSCEAEIAPALDWCVDHAPSASYLRLVSVPCDVPYCLPPEYVLTLGRGVALTEGGDAVILGYGPILLAEAVKAARLLNESGIMAKVVNLPWLNCVDADWLRITVTGAACVVTLDNHVFEGGQGQMLGAALSGLGLSALPRLRHLAVRGLPECGAQDEVLRHHGLDAASIASTVQQALTK